MQTTSDTPPPDDTIGPSTCLDVVATTAIDSNNHCPINLLIAELDTRESSLFMEQDRASPRSEKFEYFNGAIDEIQKTLRTLRAMKKAD